MKHNLTKAESCKYRFTAYLIISLKRDRITYYNKLKRKQYSEVMFDMFDYTIGTLEKEDVHNFDEPKSILDLYFEDKSISDVIQTLSEMELEILTLKFIEDLPHKRIAARINSTKAAVDKYYQRIVSKIRKGNTSHERL